MHKRIKQTMLAAGALGALALGGSALATANSPATANHAAAAPAVEKVSATDPGPAVQQGDQTTPDSPATATKVAADPAGPNDTTSPDTGAQASENAAESSSENASETGPSDGPGGHADSTSGADTQQQGEH